LHFSSLASGIFYSICPTAANLPQGSSPRREALHYEQVDDILNDERNAACQDAGQKRKHFKQKDTAEVIWASQD
jgi:hypothetical protein